MRCERMIGNVLTYGWSNHYRQIRPVVGQPCQQLFPVADSEVQFDACVSTEKLNKQTREKIVTGAYYGHAEPTT